MEKVILIKGGQSNWYEQAIFIVKQNPPHNKIPMDFVKEAEKIIEQYMRTGKSTTRCEPVILSQPVQPLQKGKVAAKRNSFDILLKKVMLVGCVTLAMVLAYHWFL